MNTSKPCAFTWAGSRSLDQSRLAFCSVPRLAVSPLVVTIALFVAKMKRDPLFHFEPSTPCLLLFRLFHSRRDERVH